MNPSSILIGVTLNDSICVFETTGSYPNILSDNGDNLFITSRVDD